MQPRFLVRAAIALGATTMIVLLVLSAYRPVDAAAVLTAGKADLKSAGLLPEHVLQRQPRAEIMAENAAKLDQ